MELSYIVSAYKYPEHLIRLVHQLHDKSASFFIHVDRKSPDSVYAEMVKGLRALPRIWFVKRHKCHWGGFGHVAATLEGIAELFRTGTSFDYAILLTGQDYPIKSKTYITEFFEAHKGELFLEFFPLPSGNWHNRARSGGLERIEAWHWHIGNRHLRFPPGRTFPLKRRFPSGFRPFGGSSYWCLSRTCIQYIHELTTKNRGFTNFFKRVDVPDEIFFQTIVLNSPFERQAVNDDLRYIHWKDPSAGSPAILRKSDFASLVASPKLFARKFDTQVDAEVLDLIDQQIFAPE